MDSVLAQTFSDFELIVAPYFGIAQARAAWIARQDAQRQFAMAAAYLCVTPFLLLTQMHERYIAPAIALAVSAGFLDRRLRVVAWGFSFTYTLNMIAVGLIWWQPWLSLADSTPNFQLVRRHLLSPGSSVRC